MPPTTPAPTTEGSSPVPAAPTPAPVVPVTPSPAPAAAVSETPKPLTAREILAKASPEQRQQLATGKIKAAAPAAAVTPPAPVVATPPAAPAEPAAAVTPAAPATPPAAEPAETLPERFRFTSEDDQMVALLAKREKISLVEAGRRFETLRNPAGTPATPAAAAASPAVSAPSGAPAAPAASTPSPEAARITAIDTDIAQKRAEVKKLREDMEHDKADDLMVEIAALTGEKQLIAAEARRAESQQAQSFESAVMASRERAFTQFPELGDPTSSEHVGLIGYVTMEQAKPERQAFFQRPDYPELIAQEFKQKYGKPASAATPAVSTPATPPAAAVTPAAAPAPVVAKPQAKQVPATGADGRLLTTAAGNTPAPGVPTVQEAITASRSDPKLRQALRQAIHARPAPTA